MNDLIERQAAIDAVEFGITYAKAFNTETGEWKELFEESNEELRKAVKRLRDLPPAQPQRMHGKWIEKTICDDKNIIEEWQSARCSVCGKYHTTPYMYYFDNYNFCPNCGADMREESNDQDRSL